MSRRDRNISPTALLFPDAEIRKIQKSFIFYRAGIRRDSGREIQPGTDTEEARPVPDVDWIPSTVVLLGTSPDSIDDRPDWSLNPVLVLWPLFTCATHLDLAGKSDAVSQQPESEPGINAVPGWPIAA